MRKHKNEFDILAVYEWVDQPRNICSSFSARDCFRMTCVELSVISLKIFLTFKIKIEK